MENLKLFKNPFFNFKGTFLTKLFDYLMGLLSPMAVLRLCYYTTCVAACSMGVGFSLPGRWYQSLVVDVDSRNLQLQHFHVTYNPIKDDLVGLRSKSLNTQLQIVLSIVSHLLFDGNLSWVPNKQHETAHGNIHAVSYLTATSPYLFWVPIKQPRHPI